MTGRNPNHRCNWAGCHRFVAYEKWGCRAHWFRLPRLLRERVWQTFRPGFSGSYAAKTAYRDVRRQVEAWIASAPAPRAPRKPIRASSGVRPGHVDAHQRRA